MFGKKKNTEKPAPPKPSSKSNQKSFDAKEFLLFHAEKFVFGLIALLAAGLIYLGATTNSFDANRTPDKLSKQSQETIRQLGENHWDAIKSEEARVKGITDISYVAKAVESAKPMVPVALGIDPGDPNRVRERRSDPEIFPAQQLQARFFYGPIVISTSNPQQVAAAEALNKMADAKVKEEPKKEPPKNMRGGPGGGAPPGGYPGGPGGGMPPGFGGGSQAKPPSGSKRYLAAGYDRGFPSHTLAPPSDKKKVLAARDVGFVTVVALAPHGELETEYRSKLAKAGSIMPGRDTPNYVGFEVQRVDVTENPAIEIQESDWQPLPNAGSEVTKERAKSSWLGVNTEVVDSNWVMSNLTMPVPPVLIKDYRAYVVHHEVPKIGDSAMSSTRAPGGFGAPSAGGLGFGGSSFGGGDDEPDNYGSGGGVPGFGGPPGYPGGGGGAPPGYPGGGGGAPPGYPGGGGGAPPGYPGGAGGAPPGYPGGAGGAPPGYPGGTGGAPPGYGGSSTTIIAPTAEAPKELPSTKYKLVRFYDFEVKANRIYRYRVRLLMYDPNFPEAPSIQPRSSTLDVASGTLKRVQDMLEKERNELDSRKDGDGKPPHRRNSSRATAWSEASPPIATVRTIDGYLGEPKIVYSMDRERRVFEASAPRAEIAVAEFDPANAIYIPRKDVVSRGYVFGLPNKDGGKDAPFEIIHPINKLIKNLDQHDATSLATVIDLVGFAPLEVKVPKDAHLKSGTKGVLFDPESQRIVVVREFDDFAGFGMHTEPDKTAIGPLGGPLKTDGSPPIGGGGMSGPGSVPGGGMGAGLGFGGAGGTGTGGGTSSGNSASNEN